MRRLRILKTGSTMPQLIERKGDYEDWIAAGVGARDVELIHVAGGEALPDPEGPMLPTVITGSSSLITERLEWSERTAAWLPHVVRRGVPILGICYGHQLLCQGLGGVVGANPHGREIGAIDVHLTEAGRGDPLLSSVGQDTVRVSSSHRQHAATLPDGATVLATSDGDPHQAVSFGPQAWGVQFHPEWDHEVIGAYLETRREVLRQEGLDPEVLISRVAPCDHGERILARFGELAER